MCDIFAKVEKLSKAELLQLIRSRSLLSFRVSESDILDARYEVLASRAQSLMDESLAESKRWRSSDGIKARIKWLEAQDKFDRASRMYERADKLWEKAQLKRVIGSK